VGLSDKLTVSCMLKSTTANDVLHSANASFSSELDTIETSIHSSYPASYQDFRLIGLEDEWCSAIDLYAHVDNEKGTNRAENLLECRRYAWFYYNSETGHVRSVANSCRLRWCPICARTRFNIVRYSVREWLSSVRSPKFLTLTVRNVRSPLQEQISGLFDAFHRFRRHKGISSRVRGGIWFLQVKRGKNSGQWHPHLHIALDSDYIPKRDLSLDWFLSTGNSFVIDIRKIDDPSDTADYVARYVARPAKLSDFFKEDQYEMFYVLHSKRLFGTFGSGKVCRFKPVPAPDFYKWQRIGSWSSVVSASLIDPSSRKIVRAFFTDTVVSPEVAYDATEEWLRDLIPTISNPVIENRQMTFHNLYERPPDG
jgi:hypothetical protein